MAVPEQRHPLGEWSRRADHVIDPPLLQPCRGEFPAGCRCRVQDGRLSRLAFDQPIDGLAETVGKRRIELRRTSFGYTPAQQLHHPRGL
jgi:hypothetical protein